MEEHLSPFEKASQYKIPGGTDCYLYLDCPTGRLSCAYIEMGGRYPEEGMRKNISCTESIFVTEGALLVELENRETVTLHEKDLFYVPLGVGYSISGKGKAVVFIEPRWDSTQNVPV